MRTRIPDGSAPKKSPLRVNKQRRRPCQEHTIMNYVDAARALDRWMTAGISLRRRGGYRECRGPGDEKPDRVVEERLALGDGDPAGRDER